MAKTKIQHNFDKAARKLIKSTWIKTPGIRIDPNKPLNKQKFKKTKPEYPARLSRFVDVKIDGVKKIFHITTREFIPPQES